MNYVVYLSDVSLQDALVTYLYSIEGVRLVRYSALTANTLGGVNLLIGYVSLGIIAVLLAVSVFLISNTVTVYRRLPGFFRLTHVSVCARWKSCR